MRTSIPNANCSSRLGYSSAARRVACGNSAGDSAGRQPGELVMRDSLRRLGEGALPGRPAGSGRARPGDCDRAKHATVWLITKDR
jgi:hypothetical protein